MPLTMTPVSKSDKPWLCMHKVRTMLSQLVAVWVYFSLLGSHWVF